MKLEEVSAQNFIFCTLCLDRTIYKVAELQLGCVEITASSNVTLQLKNALKNKRKI